MRLTGPRGAAVDLDVVGHQFTLDELGPEHDEWDAAWLVISGWVQLQDGTAWSFTEPALVVDEAEDLLDWLQDDARATAPPLAEVLGTPGHESPWEAEATRRHWLAFTEPCLAFATAADADAGAGGTGGAVLLLVGLGAECAAPAVRAESEDTGWSHGRLPWSAGIAAETAADWAAQLLQLPPRRSPRAAPDLRGLRSRS